LVYHNCYFHQATFSKKETTQVTHTKFSGLKSGGRYFLSISSGGDDGWLKLSTEAFSQTQRLLFLQFGKRA